MQGYNGERLQFSQRANLSVVGDKIGLLPSAGGKSTISAILMGRNQGYTGSVTIGGVELRDISEQSLMAHITYVSHQSYLFKGTVRDNLLLAKPDATDEQLWQVLRRVKLEAFLQGEQGLDTALSERGENLSGVLLLFF